jgi:hypothetical protein
MAIWIRRTLIRTSAPILSSFSRILPQLGDCLEIGGVRRQPILARSNR